MNFETFKNALIFVGPGLALLFAWLFPLLGMPQLAAITAGITFWVGLWWIFEPIPIPATSLIPFAAFPMAGVLSNKEVAQAYGHWLIMLLLGGFILSAAMEKSGVHRRVALFMIELVGRKSPRHLILGVMLATAFLSGWISNTATTLMMLPVVVALCAELPGPKSVCALLLGLAYSASIGGIATPIGTPPNVVLMGVYQETTGADIAFLDWMLLGYPVAIVLLLLAWIYLTRNIERDDLVQADMSPHKLGSISTQEKRVLIVFALTALAWITRKQPAGGWSYILETTTVGDDTVALAAAALVFVVPNGSGGKLLDWESAVKIPWGLLILFGGGIAVAKAFGASGLSEFIGQALSGVTALPVLVMIALICCSVTFLTEMTSNTATTTLLMPILAAAALAANTEPLLLMLPAALSASCAFMLPVATAPNAIVFGSGMVTVKQMAQEGFMLNIIGIVVVTLGCFFGGSVLLF
ncbi:MAG: sodium:dicarboxylate symporter [Proteobacteria bacterium]|nr:sodium:dicarboxylate symporter [Pseudomonadota bacterium]